MPSCDAWAEKYSDILGERIQRDSRRAAHQRGTSEFCKTRKFVCEFFTRTDDDQKVETITKEQHHES